MTDLVSRFPSDSDGVLPPHNESVGQLDELLTEVSALAIRLRQNARRVQTASDLPGGGRNVLKMLRRFGALTVPHMARLDSTSRQNIQTVVNRLEREGCVEFAPNPAHKRSDLVRLTDLGVASLNAVSLNEEANKEKMLSQVSKAELVKASELLRSIREVLCGGSTPSHQSQPGTQTREKLGKKLTTTERISSESRTRMSRPQPVQADQPSSDDNELPISLL